MKRLGLLALSISVVTLAEASAQYPSVRTQPNQLRQGRLTRPTVSPYLHLANQPTNVDGTPRYGGIYQTLVRPQLEQREFTIDQEREIARIQSNMLQLQNQLHGQISTGVRPTGHQSRFMSFSHFYPQVKR